MLLTRQHIFWFLMMLCMHARFSHPLFLQERIKALIEERKELLEGGGAEAGSGSHSNSGTHMQLAAHSSNSRQRTRGGFYNLSVMLGSTRAPHSQHSTRPPCWASKQAALA